MQSLGEFKNTCKGLTPREKMDCPRHWNHQKLRGTAASKATRGAFELRASLPNMWIDRIYTFYRDVGDQEVTHQQVALVEFSIGSKNFLNYLKSNYVRITFPIWQLL